MVKSATITVEEGAADKSAEDKAPAVVKAKAEAIKTLAVEKTTIRRQVYSNDNWNKRRKVLFASLIFIAINVQYLIVWGVDDGLRQNIAIALVSAGVAIIGSYVFGAVWDDNNKRSTLAATDVPPEE
jgi:hypothetical protein